MHKSISNRALLRSILAGVVVLAGSSACSRPDRTDGGDTTNQPAAAAMPADTQAAATATSDTHAAATHETAATPPEQTPGTDQGVSGYQPMTRDTLQNDTSSRTGAGDTTDTVAVGDSAQIGKPGERLEGGQPSEQANEDTLDTQPDSVRIRPPEDTSETSGEAVGSSEMARDTSAAVAQGDTLVQADTSVPPAAGDTAAVSVAVDTSAPDQAPIADTTTQVMMDTSATTTAEVQAADTSALRVSVDTSTTDQQTEGAVQNQPGVESAVADTAVVVGDSAEVGKPGERLEPQVATAETNADTLGTDAERVRPPEDSTEAVGNVTPEEANAEAAEVESRDASEVAAAGVESTGNVVTGANAVAEMTRQGQDCSVMTGPENVRWDMALSPATLNPCGTGTMTLPKIVTGEE